MKRVVALLFAIVSAACADAPPAATSGAHVAIFFEPGSETPKVTSKDAMAYFIEKYAQETKHSGRSPDVNVVGHSDATGDATANEKLSLRRAAAVADLLVKGGIPHDRLKVSGRGAHDPLVMVGPSSNAQERADAFDQNRRVEIELVSRPY